MTKYQEIFNKMLEQNKELFEQFSKLHDEYALNSEELQDRFNQLGAEVQGVIKTYEDRLCGHSEGSGYAAYSGQLAEKFQGLVRKKYPKIDFVGVKIKPAFTLKKLL